VTSTRLTAVERQVLLDHYRPPADPVVGHRAHILLLLDAGHPWATIGAVLFCSLATISAPTSWVRNRVRASIGIPPGDRNVNPVVPGGLRRRYPSRQNRSKGCGT
jgi:hypothetical protein